MDLHKAAAEVLYGKLNDESLKKLGELSINIYKETMIGRTMFSLLGKDFKKIVLNAPKFYSSATVGINVEVEDISDNKVKLIIKNDPYPIAYNKGLYLSAGRMFGQELKILANRDNNGDTEYLFEW